MHFEESLLSLLTGDTHGLTTATRCASVLTTDTETISVTDTAVSTNLLQALQVITEIDVDGVGHGVGSLAGLGFALTVEEPGGDLPLERIGEDVAKAGDFLVGEGTSTAGNVNAGLLANDVGEANTNTLDNAESVGDLALAVNVGVQHTDDVLEALGLHLEGRHVGLSSQ